jgi:hypothetical protein
MIHIVLRRLLKLNCRVSEQGYVVIKSKNWQGVPIDFKLKTRKNILPDLTSQMRKIRTLKKLRCKPHGSEVFHCGSMGIYADGVGPQRPDPVRVPRAHQRRVQVHRHAKRQPVACHGHRDPRVPPHVRQRLKVRRVLQLRREQPHHHRVVARPQVQLQQPDDVALQERRLVRRVSTRTSRRKESCAGFGPTTLHDRIRRYVSRQSRVLISKPRD